MSSLLPYERVPLLMYVVEGGTEAGRPDVPEISELGNAGDFGESILCAEGDLAVGAGRASGV